MELYDQEYDAYFDSDTGEWISKKCTDSECAFCVARPDKHDNLEDISEDLR